MPAPELIESRIEVANHHAVLSEVGSGPPILFLPSMLIRTRSYRRTLHCLARCGHRVISVEMPGSGRASRLMKPWSFEDYGDWIGQLLEKLDLQNPILIGHSDSAGAALCAASLHPKRVGKLVLCAGVGFDMRFSFWRIAIGRLIDVPLEPDFSMLAAVDVAYNGTRHFRNFFHQIWICTKSDLRFQAAHVEAPTLLAWGAGDHAIPIRCAQTAAQYLTRSETYISRAGRHDWLADYPEEFAEAVVRFAYPDFKPQMNTDEHR